MKALNKETAAKTQRPERIIQFGEGNFLRAFVDWIIYNMNEKTDFNSSVVVVQPIEKGMVDMLNAQDCLYHVNLQGLDKGQVVNSLTKIDVISRALNPYSQNDEFMKLAEQPEMRFVISNTTEAGIEFAERQHLWIDISHNLSFFKIKIQLFLVSYIYIIRSRGNIRTFIFHFCGCHISWRRVFCC